ncbi:MAG TPA: endonuclease/exonuclease/phosphatase family protein [Myxococcota bacterium]|jgi:endonuclease/exonuclease/phosphatase family metal-dependent hydrolase
MTKEFAITLVGAAAALLFTTGCAERSAALFAPVGRTSCSDLPALQRPLKVANYNIKSGLWTSLADVGDTLATMDADVVALEEVDNGTRRSGSVDESAVLADRLHMQRIFAAALARDGGTYGVALLSKLPMLDDAERVDLPDVGNFEPRVAIDATICRGDAPLRVLAAHADVFPWAAQAQAKFIADRVDGSANTLVLGDLNATPDTGDTKPFLDDGYADALSMFDDKPTFPGNKTRIDYILSDDAVASAHVLDSQASDHFPVVATIAPQ